MRKTYTFGLNEEGSSSGKASAARKRSSTSSGSDMPLLLSSLKDLHQGENNTTASLDHRLRDKFRGCLVGALVGDCIGTLFECDYSVSYTILGDLYMSLTNLSDDEKLMDFHGIDFSLPSKVAQELLELKRLQKQGNQRTSLESKPSIELTSVQLSPDSPKRHSSYERRRGSFSRPIEKYSDDTVMTRSVVLSLIKMKGFDVKAMAKQLTEDYFLNLTRKFSAFIREIFTNLRDSDYNDPLGPAKRSVGKFGSYGNESASRVAPVALYGWNLDPGVVVDLSTKLSKITNYNKSGVFGAICQALAVHTAFNWDLEKPPAAEPSTSRQFLKRLSIVGTPNTSPLMLRKPSATLQSSSQENIPMESKGSDDSKFFDARGFCNTILDRITHEETKSMSILENFKTFMHQNKETNKVEPTFSDKIRMIIEFLDRSEPPSRSEVVEKLGNGIKAIDSVPTALYSFLLSASCDKFPELPVRIRSPVLRSIFYAISLGGDSDTIGSMAGAIAGAYWGYEQIPNEILRVCEGSKETMKIADELFNMCH